MQALEVPIPDDNCLVVTAADGQPYAVGRECDFVPTAQPGDLALSSPAAFLGWAMHALLVCLCCLRFSLRHFGYLFAGARAKCLQLFQWQVIRDETHRAIGKGEGGTARMITAEGGKAKH